MKILFIDESFILNCNCPLFVLGGVVIPEESWKLASDTIDDIKRKNNISVNQEIEWKWIFSKKTHGNPLSHLTFNDRLHLVIEPMLQFIKSNKLELFTTLTHINDLKEEFLKNTQFKEDNKKFNQEFTTYYYHKNYENIVQRFQYYLQDCENQSQNAKGIIICDHRCPAEDDALRQLHLEMLRETKGRTTIKYHNLIEHVLLAPSHFSVGIQFADIIAGVILGKLRKYPEVSNLCEIIIDCFNTRLKDGKPTSEGRGVVKIPKDSKYWIK
ncbi:MAG: hypothetical protein QG673_2019 [Pseudomonadota bacterium]|nr:hypothetical protein [Pseudomonadota bacterium]